jgi:hypothetical protein
MSVENYNPTLPSNLGERRPHLHRDVSVKPRSCLFSINHLKNKLKCNLSGILKC